MSEKIIERSQALSLAGARVLLVEDEYLIADELRRVLVEAGAEIAAVCGTVDKAHKALDAGNFDCAVIDLNLRGESAVPIADRLVESGKSFGIATGYGSSAVPERLRNVPRIEKPFEPSRLLDLVAQLRCSKSE